MRPPRFGSTGMRHEATFKFVAHFLCSMFRGEPVTSRNCDKPSFNTPDGSAPEFCYKCCVQLRFWIVSHIVGRTYSSSGSAIALIELPEGQIRYSVAFGPRSQSLDRLNTQHRGFP